ncbi:hypothetical protein B0H17DRAFT_1211266 [Mycena rosella]|uniref:Uncharacterized protein n=1 Tax=Mycena rosella TaxID=1033263 RepID=A0AAD7CUR9_MYCRO|nr:hypothetical protein B0H17DRAFT_1211266 [Mycena rosella]
MPVAFSLPALAFALLFSFSPAALFGFTHPIDVPAVHSLPKLDHSILLTLHTMLDALEEPIYNPHFPTTSIFSELAHVFDPDASKTIGTRIDAGEEPFFISRTIFATTTSSTLMLMIFCLVLFPLVLRILLLFSHFIDQVLTDITRLCDWEDDIYIPATDTTRVGRPDRVHAHTYTPTTLSPRSIHVRTRSAFGQLVLVPASPTLAGVAVHRVVVVPEQRIEVTYAPVELPAGIRVQRPDRVRMVTEAPVTSSRSSRLRTSTAPGQLKSTPSLLIPAGAALPRILPLPPLRIPTAARAQHPPLLFTPAAHAPTVEYTSGAVIYQTSAVAPYSVIYSTSGMPTIAAQRVPPRSPRAPRRSHVVFHGRSAPPIPVAPLALTPLTRAQAEAHQRASQQHYAAQHRPGALAHFLSAAQGRALGAQR